MKNGVTVTVSNIDDPSLTAAFSIPVAALRTEKGMWTDYRFVAADEIREGGMYYTIGSEGVCHMSFEHV